MRSIKIATVVGARPQFIKAAAISRAIAKHNDNDPDVLIDEHIIHTGQHYDSNMSDIFFEELRIPHPHTNLHVGSGSHGQQTGVMLEGIEKSLQDWTPDWLLTYGDTNSTLAAALAAAKMQIPVAHVEAGLRSFNRRMPEEINRVLTDHVSHLLFCPTKVAVANLRNEGITDGVYLTGDVMFDSVKFNLELAEKQSNAISKLQLKSKEYYLATIHRAENTNDPERLSRILDAIGQLEFCVVIPMHPRTRNTLGNSLRTLGDRVRVIPPLPYLDMLMLEKNARVILTDSGGVQKEAYWMNVPCVTLRDETEWTELIDLGVNILSGTETVAITQAVSESELRIVEGISSNRNELYGDGGSADLMISLLAALTR